MSGPRVSVVIPCFEDGATLGAAVASARGQEPCEIVVVDDGSRGAQTLRVLHQLEADGIRVLRQPNLGVSAARTAGLHGTTAPYLFNLDADDELEPGALTALADELDTQPALDLVWGRFRYTGERSHEKRVATELDAWVQTYVNDMPAAALFRRDVLLAVGGWRLGSAYQDWDLWLELAQRGVNGRGLPLVTYRYRVHGERQYRSSRRRHHELYAVLRSRHEELFHARRENRRRSKAPLLAKVAFPLIDRLWPGMSFRKASLLASLWHLANGRGGLHRPFLRLARRLRSPSAASEERLAHR